jgi:hypothetical protein
MFSILSYFHINALCPFGNSFCRNLKRCCKQGASEAFYARILFNLGPHYVAWARPGAGTHTGNFSLSFEHGQLKVLSLLVVLN